MKILYANKFFFLNGGSETVMFQERAFMQGQGAEIVDFSMQDQRNLPSAYSQYFIPPVSYRKGPLFSRLKAAASFIHSGQAVTRLTQLLKKTKPHIAHLHNIYHQLTPSIIPVLKEHGVKVVLTLHDGKLTCPGYLMLRNGVPCLDCQGRNFHLPFTTNCQQSRLSGALLMLEAAYHSWKKSYDAVDAFVTPSHFLGDTVSVRTGTERMHHLPNGIDPTAFTPTGEDKGYLLFVGRLSSEKGVNTLLRAHAAMRNPTPLVIVGTGPMEQSLRARTPAGVTFAGYQSGEDLWDYVRNASCLVMPSESYENAPMSILEGMAFAKPIVASRIGGIPEQVAHGETGLLFTPGNLVELSAALDALMESSSKRKAMGQAGRTRLETEFSLNKHNQRLLALYTALC